MKSSTLFLFSTIAIAIISIFLLVQNEMYKPNSVSEISDFTNGGPVFLNSGLEGHIESYREKKRNDILKFGGGLLVLSVIALIFTQKSEEKEDPIKNLEKLREGKIITEAEFLEKVEKAKKEQIVQQKKKDSQKLIDELTNLRNKNILTEQEYIEKLKKIQDNNA